MSTLIKEFCKYMEVFLISKIRKSMSKKLSFIIFEFLAFVKLNFFDLAEISFLANFLMIQNFSYIY